MRNLLFRRGCQKSRFRGSLGATTMKALRIKWDAPTRRRRSPNSLSRAEPDDELADRPAKSRDVMFGTGACARSPCRLKPPQPERWLRIAVFNNRSEEHTSELQSHSDLVCRLLLEKKKKQFKPLPDTVKREQTYKQEQ